MSAHWITGGGGIKLAVASVTVLPVLVASDTTPTALPVTTQHHKVAAPAVVQGENSTPIVAGTQKGKPFTIRGIVSKPLTLGVSVPILLSITNPNPYALTVRKLDIEVGHVTTATPGQQCGAGDFTVRQLPDALSLVVPAKRSVTLTEVGVTVKEQPRLTLRNRTEVNQDGCKAVQVALSVRGEATGGGA
jgi:hypothetical protein